MKKPTTIGALPARYKSLLNEYQQESFIEWCTTLASQSTYDSLQRRVATLDDNEATTLLIRESIVVVNRLKLDRKIVDSIENGHWQVMGISEGDGAPPFCYSVGLFKHHKVECLIIARLDSSTCQYVINEAGHGIKDGLSDVELQQKLSELLKHKDTGEWIRVRVTRIPMTHSLLDEYLRMVVRFFPEVSENNECIYIQIGDDKNRLPGEEGYNEVFSPSQLPA